MTTPDTLAKLAAPALSLQQISDAAREAQIAFCLGKFDSFEVALARKVEAALTAQAPAAAEPSRDDLLWMLKLAKEASADLRRAGRAEAAAIILGTDPEAGLDQCTGSSQNYPDGDYSSHWLPEKLAELLDCGPDNPMSSLLDRLEGAYWDALGRQSDAEYQAAQQAAQAPVGWQPIETAPKDGTTIIVGRDMGDFGFVRGYSRWEGGGAFVSGWISRGFSELQGELGLAHPTLWQPLPPPPAARPQAEGVTK